MTRDAYARCCLFGAGYGAYVRLWRRVGHALSHLASHVARSRAHSITHAACLMLARGARHWPVHASLFAGSALARSAHSSDIVTSFEACLGLGVLAFKSVSVCWNCCALIP
jgi:hypothetical protein